MANSIIRKHKSCYFCGTEQYLEKHHCLHGTNRQKADQDGLWVWLCPACHRGNYGVHGYHGHEYDRALQKAAEMCWMGHNGYLSYSDHPTPTEEGMRAWLARYGKNYVDWDEERATIRTGSHK